MDVEKELNAAQIGCCRIMNASDMLNEEHYRLRESHVPVVDRQSGVPIRVGGVIPKLSLTPGEVFQGCSRHWGGYNRYHDEGARFFLKKMYQLISPPVLYTERNHSLSSGEPLPGWK
jgi:crotonobetainyl-CoA:carnitine CoA-transferase CaiB-like acyl-CoA transferase